ncbi:hypothetical protein Nepgr_019344 [Nepenthes gracilis]|uniref:Uncharacterized protein n=1 Tax=Nepenthes gracilis TaxID=150966 RepID=A0AAD3XUA2_NEPGR|nr:hypothetical protein Nepgr_019344 [Nepenthes gracilis]
MKPFRSQVEMQGGNNNTYLAKVGRIQGARMGLPSENHKTRRCQTVKTTDEEPSDLKVALHHSSGPTEEVIASCDPIKGDNHLTGRETDAIKAS